MEFQLAKECSKVGGKSFPLSCHYLLSTCPRISTYFPLPRPLTRSSTYPSTHTRVKYAFLQFMDVVDCIHPSVALTAAAATYPLLMRLITPTHTSAVRFMKSREVLSVTHSTMMVSATLFELYRQADDWFPPAWRGLPTPTHPTIIDASPPFTNTILAFECGYLLQDFIVLIGGARRLSVHNSARSILARNVNWHILGVHHLSLAVGLGLFHVRALRHTAKAALVVLMMMLMNASWVFQVPSPPAAIANRNQLNRTPIGTLHWYLVRFRPEYRASVCVSHALYLIMYALARVYLPYGMLNIFGAWRGQSAYEALKNLPWECQLGTSAITGANGFWLLWGLKKFMGLYLVGGKHKKILTYER